MGKLDPAEFEVVGAMSAYVEWLEREAAGCWRSGVPPKEGQREPPEVSSSLSDAAKV